MSRQEDPMLGRVIQTLAGVAAIALGMKVIAEAPRAPDEFGVAIAVTVGFFMVVAGTLLAAGVGRPHQHDFHETGHQFGGEPVMKCDRCERVFAGDDELLGTLEADSPWQ